MNSNNTLAVQMHNITKRFPRVLANDNASFEAARGEIHALVGENGAGKSTLMHILYGMVTPDSGEIYVKGKSMKPDPLSAITEGIGMVHQHFMLVSTLSVTENIILGCEPEKNIFVDLNRAKEEIRKISQRYKFEIDPEEKIKNLSVGLQQRVEIIKLFYRGADIFILDEPTAVLTPQETEELFEILRQLKNQGKTIILITHKLNEVMAVSDRVTVMRSGKTVSTLNTKETTSDRIAELMVGRKVEQVMSGAGEIKSQNVILQVDCLSAFSGKKVRVLKDVSFDVKEGEIFGIAGVDGNGQTELIEVITGLRKPHSGKIIFNGRNITNSTPRSIYENFISHIPEDRQGSGIIFDFNVAENLVFGRHWEKEFSGIINLHYDKIEKNADANIKEYDIRPADKYIKAVSLSGGNQQKLVVARELSRKPKLLIAAKPTRGVDIGATEFIHKKLLEERARGASIILVSSELSELLSLSDRIGVMFGGEMVGIVEAATTTEKTLGILMTGTHVK
ncbi:MAG: ABC transporter ATP-binding protein [Elusimicrobiota bacterium]